MTKIESLILVNQVAIMLALAKLCRQQMPKEQWTDIVTTLYRGMISTQNAVDEASAEGLT